MSVEKDDVTEPGISRQNRDTMVSILDADYMAKRETETLMGFQKFEDQDLLVHPLLDDTEPNSAGYLLELPPSNEEDRKTFQTRNSLISLESLADEVKNRHTEFRFRISKESETRVSDMKRQSVTSLDRLEDSGMFEPRQTDGSVLVLGNKGFRVETIQLHEDFKRGLFDDVVPPNPIFRDEEPSRI